MVMGMVYGIGFATFSSSNPISFPLTLAVRRGAVLR